MRITKKLVLLLFILLTVFIFKTITPKKAYAANWCQSLTVNPSSGPPTTTFVITLTNCKAGHFILNLSKDAVVVQSIDYWAGGSYSQNFSGLASGNYTAWIVMNDDSVSFTVTPGVIPPPTCCTLANQCSCPVCTAVIPNCSSKQITGCGGPVFFACTPDPPPPGIIIKNKVFCGENNELPQIDTALGCIPFESPQAFTEFLLRWAMGIVGGIALILIVVAGYQIISSAGNPQKLNAGKELLTAAIMGIIMLLFGVYILKLIGVTILNIPGF